MPLGRREVLQLGLLILCVPAQYFISKYSDSNENQRSISIKRLLSTIHDIRNSVSNWEFWGLFSSVPWFHWRQDDSDPNAQSPAIEVMKYRNKEGYFAGSPVPRSPRSDKVKYRVGQVMRHRTLGYTGVIVGWDEIAKAPKAWLEYNHPANKPHWRRNPNYAVLVDVRDRSDPQLTYVAEENVEIIPKNSEVKHPLLKEYFSSFDGAQYIPKSWLRKIYPHD